MAKPSRSPRDGRQAAGRGRPAGGRRQARPSTGRGRGRRRAVRRRPLVGWGRRAGLVLAMLVIGTSIVIAGQALNSDGPPGPADGGDAQAGRSPTPAASIPPAPSLEQPAATLVAAASTEVTVSVPDEVPRDGSHQLRVYVNGDLVRERRLPRRGAATIRSVPLAEGENAITAAIFGPGGESLHSPPISVTRDDVAPGIRISEPRGGEVVHSEQVIIRGRTEPGASVSLTNEATGQAVEARVDGEGRFEATLNLAAGGNRVTLQAEDAAGNRSRSRLSVRHEPGAAAAVLALSRDELQLASLPALVTLSAEVVDESGAPSDGAQVTFSLSVPGQSTATYRTTTQDGAAVWQGARIPAEGTSAGPGYATVLVVLPSGRTLQDSARFNVR